MQSVKTTAPRPHLQIVSETSSTAELSSTKPYQWILHPVLDILFCCGGLVWILFGGHIASIKFLGADNPVLQQLLLVSAVGTLVFGESHIAATLLRIYKPAANEKISKSSNSSDYAGWGAVTCGILALAGLFTPGLPSIYVKLYLLIVAHHFTAQTYGLVILYCYKRDYKLGRFDKASIAAVLNTTMLFAVVRQLTYRSWSGETFLEQRIPFWAVTPEWVLHATIFALAVCVLNFMLLVIRRSIMSKEVFPLPSLLLLISGVAIFVLGSKMTGILWLYAPAFFHGSQYLILTTAAHLKEQGLPEQIRSKHLISLLSAPVTQKYFGLLLMVAIFIYAGVPHVLSQFGFDDKVAFAVVFTTMNFHHFICDRFLWKMRNPKVRALLLD